MMSRKMRQASKALLLSVATSALPVYADLNLSDPSIMSLYRFNEQTSGQLDNSVAGSFVDSAITGSAQNHDDFFDDASDGPAWTSGAAYNSVSGTVGDGTGLAFSRADNDRTRIAPWYEVSQGNYTEGKSFSIMLRVKAGQLTDNVTHDLFGFGSTAISLAGVSGGGQARLDVKIRDGGVGGNGAETFWTADSLTNNGSAFKVISDVWTNVFVIYDANTGITLASDDGTTFAANSSTSVPAGFDSLVEGFSDADRRWVIGSLTPAAGSYDGLIESIVIWDKALSTAEAAGIGLANAAPTWNSSNSGDWNVAGNWSTGEVPNAVGAVARFYGAITANKTVYTDVAVTAGTLRFNNSNTYVISGAGTLTLQNIGSESALVDVQSGVQKISVPLVIASDTSLSVASGATLKISNPLTINSGKNLTQTGGGNVIYESTITVQPAASIGFVNATHAHSLALQGTASASIATHAGPTPTTLQLDSLSLDAASKLDLKNNRLLVTSSAAAIRANITSGSIFSSSATPSQNLGYADAGSGNVQVVYTLQGDTNLNLQVDSTDFNAFLAGYGKNTSVNWVDGDFNYDGKVNTIDFNSLAGNFGSPLAAAPALGSVVPEPGSALLLTSLLAPLVMRRQTR